MRFDWRMKFHDLFSILAQKAPFFATDYSWPTPPHPRPFPNPDRRRREARFRAGRPAGRAVKAGAARRPKSVRPSLRDRPRLGRRKPARQNLPRRPRGAASPQTFTRMQRQRAKGRLSKPGKALTPSQCACASTYCHIAILPYRRMAPWPHCRVSGFAPLLAIPRLAQTA